MIEKLPGKYCCLKYFESREELINDILLGESMSLCGGFARLHLYSGEEGSVLVVYLTPDSTMYAEYLSDARMFKLLSDDYAPDFPPSGYVEIYCLNREQFDINMEVFSMLASMMGVELKDIIKPLHLSVTPTQTLTASSESEGGTQGWELIHFLSLLTGRKASNLTDSVDAKLSRSLSSPSTIASIILDSNTYIYDRGEYANLLNNRRELLNNINKNGAAMAAKIELEELAIQLWLAKINEKIGLYVKLNKEQAWGTKALELIKNIVVRNNDKISIHIYKGFPPPPRLW